MRLWRGLPPRNHLVVEGSGKSQWRKMNKYPKLFRSPIHKPYWGVLARDLNIQTIHKPENFMDLLQSQSKNTDVVPVPAVLSPKLNGVEQDKVSGKNKHSIASKNIPF
jgi:hypothetical protein